MDKVSELCHRAMALSHRVSSSFALSPGTWQEIDEIQNQLLVEIERVSPARAAGLRLMLYRLNENHLACLIHVSERSRSLVFIEFVRQSVAILSGNDL